MPTERWAEIERIFHQAAGLPPRARRGFLARACNDTGVRLRVEALLRGHDRPAAFLDTPAMGPDFHPCRAGEGRDPLLGRRIGPFRIEQRIAEGGMGTVYRAVRVGGFAQTVAVKVLHRRHGSGDIPGRFQAERQTLARLGHPHIARLFDAGTTGDGLLYLVMELVEGRPLDEYCNDERLTIRQRLDLFEVVARTVHFAHRNLVVHRDLKPGNVLVTDDGFPKLLDFGISEVLDQGDPRPDGNGHAPSMVMTPEYASPEQLGGGAITTATDVYSLGVLLHLLLTGSTPHRWTARKVRELERPAHGPAPSRPSTVVLEDAGGSPAARAACRGVTPARLHRLLRGDLDGITAKCLHGDPDRRYASALQLAEDLERHRNGQPVLARGDSLGYRTAKFARRNWLPVGAGLALVLALSGGMASTAWQAGIAAEERDAARTAARLARAAEQHAVAQAEHAGVEAESAGHLVDFLVDAFLASVPHSTPEQIADAEAHLDLQVQRVRRRFAGDPHLRANLLDALGSVYLSLGRHARAHDVIADAAAIRREEFGTDSLEYALSLGSAAGLAYAEQRYADAVDGFRKALELHRRLPPGVHTNVATAVNDLAVALRNLGDFAGAEALHGEALGLRRQLHGKRHPLVAESLNNLANVLMQRGDDDRAIDLLRRALTIRIETLGEVDRLTAQSRNNLANALELTGDLEGAEPLYRRAVEQMRGPLGADPEGLAVMLVNHAGVLRGLGRNTGARRALDEALAIRRAHFGDGSLQVASALAGLARLDTACGRRERALSHWQEVLAIQRRKLPRGHVRIATTLTDHGRLLLHTGDPPAAEPMLREALATYRAALPPGHWFIALAQVNLGDCLTKLGSHAEAETLLLEACGILERERGPDSAELQTARASLALLYELRDETDRTAGKRR